MDASRSAALPQGLLSRLSGSLGAAAAVPPPLPDLEQPLLPGSAEEEQNMLEHSQQAKRCVALACRCLSHPSAEATPRWLRPHSPQVARATPQLCEHAASQPWPAVAHSQQRGLGIDAATAAGCCAARHGGRHGAQQQPGAAVAAPRRRRICFSLHPVTGGVWGASAHRRPFPHAHVGLTGRLGSTVWRRRSAAQGGRRRRRWRRLGGVGRRGGPASCWPLHARSYYRRCQCGGGAPRDAVFCQHHLSGAGQKERQAAAAHEPFRPPVHSLACQRLMLCPSTCPCRIPSSTPCWGP